MTEGLVNSMATGPTERFPQLVKVRLCFRLSPGEPFEAWGLGPGARFSKVPKPFRARKAIHKSPTRLFCEAGLFICCKGNKNVNNCKVSCLETPLSLEKHPKSFGTPVSQKSRNVSGLFRVPQFPLYLRNAAALSHQTFYLCIYLASPN